MRTFEFYTLQALENGARECARNGSEWRILRFNGFTFKCHGKWAQIMQTPDGLRDSGLMDHKTVKAFAGEIVTFIERNTKGGQNDKIQRSQKLDTMERFIVDK